MLHNQNATKEEYEDVAMRRNIQRKNAYSSLIDLHFVLQELTSEEEFVKVMKTINKSLIQ